MPIQFNQVTDDIRFEKVTGTIQEKDGGLGIVFAFLILASLTGAALFVLGRKFEAKRQEQH